MPLTNAIDFEDLVAGPDFVYGYNFNSEGIPQSFTTQVNFNRIVGGIHPTHGGVFRYLAGPLSANPADNLNGYKLYQIRGDETFVEIAPPQNAAAADAAAAYVEIGPRMPIGTLAQSVRGASWGSVMSSLITGTLVETDEMRGLLDYMRSLETQLKDQREISRSMGHGHGGSFAGAQAAADRIRELNEEIMHIDDRLATLYREQYLRYQADGGRLGILAACFGQNNRTFIESRIRTLQREIDTIRAAEHFSSYLNFGAGPPPEETEAMGISELREQITALQQQLAALPHEEGSGCTISRKSRRRRNARRRRSRATRRR